MSSSNIKPLIAMVHYEIREKLLHHTVDPVRQPTIESWREKLQDLLAMIDAYEESHY